MLCRFVGIKDQRCSGIPCVVGGFLLTKEMFHLILLFS